VHDPFGSLTPAELSMLVPGPQPQVVPALATLVDAPFSSPDWLFERKLDGERCIVYSHDGVVDLRSRTNKPVARQFPEVVAAFEAMHADDVVVDGEIVAFDGRRTSFERLQPRMHAARATPGFRGVEVFFYAFDIMYADGHDTRRLPLRRRKAVLREALTFGGTVRFSAHRNTAGAPYFEQACAQGWEGLIAKRAGAPYPKGRSKDWLKIKCWLAQEFVVGGFTDPEGSRHGFGALHIGYYDEGVFTYAGKVGSGFDERTLRYLYQELRAREIDTSPFDRGDVPRARTHWVRPELVVQVTFGEWTRDGRLRHPAFQGLRDDKVATDVVRERPV
jgi:DNA ligase D-like protein (predicted ligase)